MENLCAHVDEDGMHYSILKGISDHVKSDEAVDKEHGMFHDRHGVKRRVITTKGWMLQVDWKDGTNAWVPLAVLKESNPLETAQYAKSRGLLDEPAFAWWANHVIKKADRIVKATTHRAVKKKIKFGIVIPEDYDEAMELDKENKNTLWMTAHNKEIQIYYFHFLEIK